MRPRKHNRNLPARLYLKHGRYYYVKANKLVFVKKRGECIVGVSDDGFSTIEIYDDYR